MLMPMHRHADAVTLLPVSVSSWVCMSLSFDSAACKPDRPPLLECTWQASQYLGLLF